jgi:hypothetical protein
MVDTAPGVHARRAQWHRPHLPMPDKTRITMLLFWQIGALAGQVVAVFLARHEQRLVAEVLSDVSLAVIYASALWALTTAHLDRPTRNVAVLCLGVSPALFWRATNPMLFTGFDEQLHMRTLGDILSSHRLFEANPLLEVSPRYPGLEAVATLVHQLGVPTQAAAFLVILVCRVVLVTVLCDAIEHLSGSERAGGLAVAVYALSSQFVFFNSQFAYQTMALPLALAAVSFIARAHDSDDPMPFVGGATICVVAVAVTHHVTSFLTAALLLAWALVERGRGRSWTTYGALAAIAATLGWAIVQRQLLSDYFGPIIDDVRAQFVGGDRRELFKDSAGTAARSLDQYLLLYYAAALSVIVLVILVLAYRERHLQWGRLLLIAAMSASIPVLLAARVVPKGGELYDRFSSFLFIPFSLYVASFAAWFWWREERNPGFQVNRRVRTVRLVGIALASLAFLGGYILGSGPNWARLPGPYMPAADTRSMDAETLAAAKWARDALPAGSRIAADRVSSTLLASQAGLWPVMKGPNGTDAPALYVARTWGTAETDLAGGMRLRYLYVDMRLADQMPPYGSYFFNGETGTGQQLTKQQLAKFDRVPGITLVYRQGPVSIYDLGGLGIAELRSGWFGTTPEVRVSTQLAVGLSGGLLICLVMRSRLWPRIRAAGARMAQQWEPALTGAALLSAACLVSIALLLSGVWLTPLTVWSGAAVVAAVNYRALVSTGRAVAARVPGHTARTAVLIAIPFAVVVAASIWVAAAEDIVKVGQILKDPAAIHVVPKGPSR